LLTLELVLRFRFLLPFYSEEGTLPLRLLMPKVDTLYSNVCLHCHLYELWQMQTLISVQIILAIMYTVGFATHIVAPLCWYLYFSLTLRNTWLAYILDRYFHYLLFYSMFLPLSKRRSVSQSTSASTSSSSSSSASASPNALYCSLATVGLKALIVWIYLDAGWGKYSDPLGGWTVKAPIPALDTYARHTLGAQYLYALLGPDGLRWMTPTVVYLELFVAPISLFASYMGYKRLLYTAAALIISLHLGIALTLRNSALLSFVACVAWIVYLPLGMVSSTGTTRIKFHNRVFSDIPAALCILALLAGNLWFELYSRDCSSSVQRIWSPLLHNRWNVFVGAEEYVSWEIAPGKLADGSIVDIWGRRSDVTWAMPGGGAPCTATARPGRWRSFPYLADMRGHEGEALWSYLCREWDRENDVDNNPGHRLIKYKFFMLQADVLPNMMFGPTRKRLIQSYDCVNNEMQFDEQTDHKVADNTERSGVVGESSADDSQAPSSNDGDNDSEQGRDSPPSEYINYHHPPPTIEENEGVESKERLSDVKDTGHTSSKADKEGSHDGSEL
jgi:hypothetical protein